MSVTVQDIYRQAARLDLCDAFRKPLRDARNIGQLVDLMFTPQGLEFCEAYAFPSLEMWRGLDRTELAACGVYVDAKKITRTNRQNVVLVGNTDAVLEYDNTDCGYHVVVMHGAKAVIKASGYSAVFVTDCGGAVDKIITDNALIL